jgi:hypothetical protein
MYIHKLSTPQCVPIVFICSLHVLSLQKKLTKISLFLTSLCNFYASWGHIATILKTQRQRKFTQIDALQTEDEVIQ